jgi:hypothetical protein
MKFIKWMIAAALGVILANHRTNVVVDVFHFEVN